MKGLVKLLIVGAVLFALYSVFSFLGTNGVLNPGHLVTLGFVFLVQFIGLMVFVDILIMIFGNKRRPRRFVLLRLLSAIFLGFFIGSKFANRK